MTASSLQSIDTHHPAQRQQGMTLVELMIAMVISLLLLGGTIQLFISNKQTYRTTEASSRLQENARFALEFLSQDLRMAGYLGCANISSGGITVTNHVDPAKYESQTGSSTSISTLISSFAGAGAIQGYSYTTGSLPAEISDSGLSTGSNPGNVVENTDILVIKHSSSCPGGNVLSYNEAAATFQIADNSQCGIQQNDIVVVSNCQSAEIFGVTNNPGGTGSVNLTHGNNLFNGAPPKLDNDHSDSSIYKLGYSILYIGNGTAIDADGNPVPSLFKRTLQTGGFINQELVEDIEDMIILYGVDTADNGSEANYYVPPGSVTVADWENVVSAKINLVVRSSTDNITVANQTHSTTGVTDRRLRHTFTTTVAFRNRL